MTREASAVNVYHIDVHVLVLYMMHYDIHTIQHIALI